MRSRFKVKLFIESDTLVQFWTSIIDFGKYISSIYMFFKTTFAFCVSMIEISDNNFLKELKNLISTLFNIKLPP